MKRRLIVAGNWKMNGTLQEATAIVQELLKELPADSEAEVVLCPPFTALASVGQAIKGSRLLLGAQNTYSETKGAFTGEISPAMLKEIGCRYVILGHSERRQIFGETDELIQKKVRAVVKEGLSVIVCVGETLQQRESNQTWNVIKRQLEINLEGTTSSEAAGQLVIAYEPVWAIGTGRNATPAQAQEVHALIRDWLAQRFGKTEAQMIRIQYGGSVKPDNAGELLSQPDVDGSLVGGASLDPKSFFSIINTGIHQRKGSPCSTG